jgi:hypothetical protein
LQYPKSRPHVQILNMKKPKIADASKEWGDTVVAPTHPILAGFML